MDDIVMYMRALVLSVCSIGVSVSAQAGFMDMIGQAAQVASAVRGQPAAAPAPTVTAPEPTAMVNAEVMQGYAAMDCAALRGLDATFQQQLSVIATPTAPAEQVSKAAGLFGRASGLLGAAGALAGVNTKAIQQAAEMSQQAGQLADGIAPQAGMSAQSADLTAQLAAIQLQLQAKTCP